MKQQKMVSLDAETARIATEIGNLYRGNGGFSTWLRNQLRSYRNKSESDDGAKANMARKMERLTNINTAELLYLLQQRSEAEINALVSLLRQD
tara:strand:- start:357 stop:635 length:279 start_codon:yes stop_codon:yes gene_type:complete